MRMSKLQLIAGLAAGACVMYLLDPDRGRRRRALIRDKAAKVEHKLVDKSAGSAKDLVSRSKGVVARLRRDADERPTYTEDTAMERMDTADEARSAAEEIAALAQNAVAPPPD